MVFNKVAAVAFLASLVTCEPPVQGSGYNYPTSAGFGGAGFRPTNTYLPPSTGVTSYSPPTNNYLPPTSFSGSGHSYDNGHSGGHGHGHDNEVPKSYEFGYAVKDALSGNDYNRREASDGNVVRGEYRVQLPDGRTQIVTYHADWQTGFHADVRYEGQARYPEPTNDYRQGGYNYNAPSGFSGSLTGFQGNVGHRQPTSAYGPPGYH